MRLFSVFRLILPYEEEASNDAPSTWKHRQVTGYLCGTPHIPCTANIFDR